MATETSSDDVPLPKSWPANVRSAILQVISLAHLAIIYSRSWAANSANARVRLQAKLEHCRNEVSSLKEELRIKDSRMRRLDAHRRPHYRPTERLAILELQRLQNPHPGFGRLRRRDAASLGLRPTERVLKQPLKLRGLVRGAGGPDVPGGAGDRPRVDGPPRPREPG